jgi:hypothetical protein
VDRKMIDLAYMARLICFAIAAYYVLLLWWIS